MGIIRSSERERLTLKFMSTASTTDWVKSHLPGMDFGFTRHQPGAILRPGSFENLPAGRVLYFGTAALLWVVEGGGTAERAGTVLLWVREYDIWPSSEHLPLERAIRERWADSGTHESHPGLLADPGDPRQWDDLISYTYLAMNFGWGITLAGDRGGRVVHANHDGYLWAMASDPTDRASAERWLNT